MRNYVKIHLPSSMSEAGLRHLWTLQWWVLCFPVMQILSSTLNRAASKGLGTKTQGAVGEARSVSTIKLDMERGEELRSGLPSAISRICQRPIV